MLGIFGITEGLFSAGCCSVDAAQQQLANKALAEMIQENMRKTQHASQNQDKPHGVVIDGECEVVGEPKMIERGEG